MLDYLTKGGRGRGRLESVARGWLTKIRSRFLKNTIRLKKGWVFL